LQKWKEQVTAAEKEAFNAWQAHDELKQKVCSLEAEKILNE
jgi:hypothetical protein